MLASVARTFMLAIALVGARAWGQESVPEVRRVTVQNFVLASAELRSTVVALGLDTDHDQYLTEAEIVVALNEAQQAVDNASLRHYMAGRQDTLRGNVIRDLQDPAVQRAARGASSNNLRQRRLERLAAANRELVSTTGFELSLVDEGFHALFAGLPPEQRSALLEADVEGNNDGVITSREFYRHNRRLFSRKTRFEAVFGEDAYLDVLRLLGVL